MSEEPTPTTPDWAHSFGGVADAYERARPTYPPEAAQWLVGQQAATSSSSARGPASSPSSSSPSGTASSPPTPTRPCSTGSSASCPEVSTRGRHAEELPVGDRLVDAVVAAQAFHWFDLDRALPEIARALKPGGRLGLVWN